MILICNSFFSFGHRDLWETYVVPPIQTSWIFFTKTGSANNGTSPAVLSLMCAELYTHNWMDFQCIHLIINMQPPSSAEAPS